MSLMLELLFHPLSFSLLLFFLILLVFRYNRPPTSKYNLPPSPWKLPIIGNMHQLGPSLHRTLKSLGQRHGPLMLLYLGSSPSVVVSSADVAREVLKTHDLIFSSRPKSSIAKRLLYDYKDVALAPYSEYWRQMRRICILQLLSAKQVQSFQSVREEETALMIKKIEEQSGSSSLNLSEMFVSLTNNIICRISFGRKYSGLESGRNVKEMIGELLSLLGVIDLGDFIPSLAWLKYINGLYSRVEKNFRELDCFLEEIVQEHVDRRNRDGDVGGDDEGDGKYLVDVLLDIQKDSTIGVPIARDNIKAIILDMFAAGTDTTYTAMEWEMAELLRHPEVMKEVQEEVRGIARGKTNVTERDVEKMYYLKAVVKETLRLHPPIPLLVARESTQHVKIQGYDIPAKTRVFINAWAIGRDPASWEEPEEFRPKRFFNSSIDFKGHNFELIPFGSGRRGCPGITFAIAVNELVLANLLHRFNWTLPGGASGEYLDMTEASGAIVHRKSPLLVVATPHNMS